MATYWPTDSTWYWSTTTSATTTITWPHDLAWQTWGTQTNTIQLNSTWETWNWTDPVYPVRPISVPPTPEQLIEAEAHRAAQERLWADQQQERELANATARVLLEAVLSETQLRDHQQHGFFEVLSAAGRRYRIHTGNGSNAGNIKLMVGESGEQVAASLCAHLYGREPVADSWIAQKLALEDDEEGFWAVANPSWHRPREIEVPTPQFRTRGLRERPVQLAA